MRHFRTTALAALICAVATIGAANTYTVTSTADSGAGTLRQAILDANANPGADTIAFNITGSGVHTIALTSDLPYITDAVTIDGYTQAGSSPNTHAVGEGLDTVLMIEIDGTGATHNGLWVQAPDVTIRGLAVNRSPAYQIERFRLPIQHGQSRGRRVLPRDDAGRPAGLRRRLGRGRAAPEFSDRRPDSRRAQSHCERGPPDGAGSGPGQPHRNGCDGFARRRARDSLGQGRVPLRRQCRHVRRHGPERRQRRGRRR